MGTISCTWGVPSPRSRVRLGALVHLGCAVPPFPGAFGGSGAPGVCRSTVPGCVWELWCTWGVLFPRPRVHLGALVHLGE